MKRALKPDMVWCVSVIGHSCPMCAFSTAWQQLLCKPCLLEAIHMENHVTASHGNTPEDSSDAAISPYSHTAAYPIQPLGAEQLGPLSPAVPKLKGSGEPCTGRSQPRRLRSEAHPPPTSILHLQRRVCEDTDPGAAGLSHCSGEGAEGWRWKHSHCRVRCDQHLPQVTA